MGESGSLPVYMWDKGHAGPPGIGDDVSDGQVTTTKCTCDHLESSSSAWGEGNWAWTTKLEEGGPLHADHVDV